MITLVIAALFVTVAGRAEVVTKGGASGLMKAPTVRSEAPGAMAMSCPKCQSEFSTVAVLSFKGAGPSTVIRERHACSHCENKWVTTGHGKTKVETAVHACAGCKS